MVKILFWASVGIALGLAFFTWTVFSSPCQERGARRSTKPPSAGNVAGNPNVVGTPFPPGWGLPHFTRDGKESGQ
jgi:peptidoglycan/LPS O-acetylase OafA/YrhL